MTQKSSGPSDPQQTETVVLGDLTSVSPSVVTAEPTDRIHPVGSFAHDDISSTRKSDQLTLRQSANIERVALEQKHEQTMFKERATRVLGFSVIGAVIGTVFVLLGWGVWASSDPNATRLAEVKDMGEFLLPYLGTALGFVLGYYFSGRSSDQR